MGRWKGDVIFCVYSQTFLGMSSNSPGNPQTSRVMSPNIPGNIAKHSRECSQTFRRMSRNIPRNVCVTPRNEIRVSPRFYVTDFVFGVCQEN